MSTECNKLQDKMLVILSTVINLLKYLWNWKEISDKILLYFIHAQLMLMYCNS